MINLVVAGLVSGSIYALMAVGLIVVYRASRVMNFAHGTFVGFAAFLALSLHTSSHLPLWAAGGIAIVATVALALLTEGVFVYPLRHASRLELLAVTAGVSLVLSGGMLQLFGTQDRLFPRFAPGTAFRLANSAIPLQNVTTILATLAVLGIIAALFYLTRIGVAMRAASENAQLSMLVGISPKAVSVTSWGVAGAMAAAAAILVAPDVPLTADTFSNLMIQSFAALVLGGFTSLLGAVVGGYLLGVGLNLFSFFVKSDIPSTFILCVVLGVLMIRPEGLFGRKESLRL